MLIAIIDALFPNRKSRLTDLEQKVGALMEDLYRRSEGALDVKNPDHFVPVPKFTQGSKKGKVIFCPHCGHSHKVYHFAWTALECARCGETTTKYNWLMRRKEKMTEKLGVSLERGGSK
jgi:hypothetical protein